MFLLNMPVLYRGLAVFLVAVGLFSFGYYKGHSNMKEKFDAYKAEVEAAALAQEATVKRIEKQSTNINKDVSNAYNRDLAAVRNYYQRLLNNQGSSSVSSVSSGSSGADAGTKDQLLGDCAETTLQLIHLQDWVSKQQINFNIGE